MEVEEFKRKVEKAMRYSELECADCNGSIRIQYIDRKTEEGTNNWWVGEDGSITIQSDWAICSYNRSQYKKIHIPDIIDVKPVKHHLLLAYFIGFNFLFAFATVFMYAFESGIGFTLSLSQELGWVGFILSLNLIMLFIWWYPRHRFKKEYGEI